MTSPFGSQITTELLSAYIDGEVNSEEARLVELAIAADPEIAWQVDSLRQTVELLAQVPAVALPQTFALSELQVADVVATRRSAHRRAESSGTRLRRAWQRLLIFFSGGNMLLRNTAALATVAFIVLIAGDLLTATPPSPGQPAILAEQSQSAAAEIAPAQDVAPAQAEVAADSAAEPVAKMGEPSTRMATPRFQEEEPAAESAMDGVEEVVAEAEPLVPDPAPMSFAAEAPPADAGGVGGAGGAGGAGGGGDGPPAPAALMAPAAAEMPQEEVTAAASLVTPTPEESISAASSAEAVAVEEEAISAAAMPQSEAPAAIAPMSAPMDAPAEEPAPAPAAMQAAPESVNQTPAEAPAEIAADTVEPVLMAPATEADASAEANPLDNSPFSTLRLLQLSLAVIALLLSTLWVRSK